MTILSLFTCHNRIEKTKSCTTSLEESNANLCFEFIVADDASTDGTTDYLKSKSNVMVVGCDGNAYYSGGMRTAIDCAKKHIEVAKNKYDFVLLLKDDFLCYENGISRMIELHQKAGCKSIIVASTEGIYGECSYGGIVSESKIRAKFKMVMTKVNEEIQNLDIESLKADTCNANCVLIPTDVFESIPDMNPVYVHSLGDFDYGFTATKLGYDIFATPFYAGYCENDYDVKGRGKIQVYQFLRGLKRKNTI